jgi:hypothetical protein
MGVYFCVEGIGVFGERGSIWIARTSYELLIIYDLVREEKNKLLTRLHVVVFFHLHHSSRSDNDGGKGKKTDPSMRKPQFMPPPQNPSKAPNRIARRRDLPLRLCRRCFDPSLQSVALALMRWPVLGLTSLIQPRKGQSRIKHKLKEREKTITYRTAIHHNLARGASLQLGTCTCTVPEAARAISIKMG